MTYNHWSEALPACVLTNMHPQDVPEWHQGDSETHENDGEGDLYDVGQECLDRISLALGGNTIAPIAQSLFVQLMADADWRKRHAALICLAQIAEGCVKVMTTNMGSLVQMCIVVRPLADVCVCTHQSCVVVLRHT